MTAGGVMAFIAGMAAALLPFRHWDRLPSGIPVRSAAFLSGLATLFAGMAIGIPGFLAHAHATTSLGLDAQLHDVFTHPHAGYSEGLAMGFSGLSIFTFLLGTPAGWITLYLTITGTVRAMAAWFDDPVGDPVLTGVDAIVATWRTTRQARASHAVREGLEGPDVPDRLVSAGAAGLPPCDLVVVAARRKPGWDRGAAVITPDTCFRIGEPEERTIAGRLRYLYPLTEHKDFEAIRRSVHYELPAGRPARAPDVT